MRGARAAQRQGSSPEWAETRVACDDPQAKTVNAAPGATRLEPGPKGTRKSRLFSFSKRARRAVSTNVSGTQLGTFSGLFVANYPF
jgi:hypothetical protein